MRSIKPEPFPYPKWRHQPFCDHLAGYIFEIGRRGMDWYEHPLSDTLHCIIKAADTDFADPVRDLKLQLERARELRPKRGSTTETEWSPERAPVRIDVDITFHGNLRFTFDLMDADGQYVNYHTEKTRWGYLPNGLIFRIDNFSNTHRSDPHDGLRDVMAQHIIVLTEKLIELAIQQLRSVFSVRVRTQLFADWDERPQDERVVGFEITSPEERTAKVEQAELTRILAQHRTTLSCLSVACCRAGIAIPTESTLANSQVKNVQRELLGQGSDNITPKPLRRVLELAGRWHPEAFRASS